MTSQNSLAVAGNGASALASDRFFPLPLVVDEPFVSEAEADSAARRGVLLEESDAIDCDHYKAVIDFKEATLSVLRVGAAFSESETGDLRELVDDTGEGGSQMVFETARLRRGPLTGGFDVSSIPPVMAGGAEHTVVGFNQALQIRGVNGELIARREFGARIVDFKVSPRYHGRCFIVLATSFRRFFLDADDIENELGVFEYALGFFDSQHFLVADGQLLVSLRLRASFGIFAFDESSNRFVDALEITDDFVGGRPYCPCWFGDRLLVRPPRHGPFGMFIRRIERVVEADGSSCWQLGQVTSIRTPAAGCFSPARLSPCGRLLVSAVFRDDEIEELDSVDEIIAANDGDVVAPVGSWNYCKLPLALQLGMPVESRLRVSTPDGRLVEASTTTPIALSFNRRDDAEYSVFHRVPGTLVARHQLSRADLEQDGVCSMRIANHDRVVIELNSGARRVFSLASVDQNEIEQENQQQQQQRRRLYQRGQHHSTAFADPLWRRDALFSIFDEDELEREEAEEQERADRKAAREQRNERRREQIAEQHAAEREEEARRRQQGE